MESRMTNKRHANNYIETYTGKKFYVLDPKPEDISIIDIAHSLSMMCRYTGHCELFYSVAQHSVYVSENSPGHELWGLLHDCVSDDTEIMTDGGWKLFKNLDKKDMVAQYGKDGIISFVRPIDYIEKDYDGDMHSFKTCHNRIDLLVTPNHRMVYFNTNNSKIEEEKANTFVGGDKKIFITNGEKLEGRKTKLSDVERFLIAYQADGWINDKRCNGKLSKHILTAFHFSKKRKIQRLEKLIKRLGWEYTRTSEKKSNNIKHKRPETFRVAVPLDTQLHKTFDWINYKEITSNWGREFIDELKHWDGSIRQNGSIYYSTIIKKNIDAIQFICAISGAKNTYKKYVDDRKEHYNDIHSTTIRMGDNFRPITSKKISKKVSNYSGKVYCVTVPSGMIVVRKNNCVVVTGNSSEAYLADIASPVKPLLQNYKELELNIMNAVCDKFGLQREMPKIVKTADVEMLRVEAYHLMKSKGVNWKANSESESPIWEMDFKPLSPKEAKLLFLERFSTLKKL